MRRSWFVVRGSSCTRTSINTAHGERRTTNRDTEVAMRRLGLCILFCVLSIAAAPRAQTDARQRAFDEVLDAYVRDGEVYYRALKLERAKLDSYIGSLAAVAESRLSREDRIALWMNAYNALVLQTVIDQYPIQKRSNDYPA